MWLRQDKHKISENIFSKSKFVPDEWTQDRKEMWATCAQSDLRNARPEEMIGENEAMQHLVIALGGNNSYYYAVHTSSCI